MRITFKWLKTFLKIDCSIQQIINDLSLIGLEVQRKINYSDISNNFIVCKIIDYIHHPINNKIKICKVFDGQKTFIIPSNSENITNNILSVISKTTKIRYLHLKNTMGKILCSENNIFPQALQDNNIIAIQKNIQLGSSYIKILRLDDTILDINITPNRGDCLSVLGISRDLQAYNSFEPTKKYTELHQKKSNITINQCIPLTKNIAKICNEIIFTEINNIKTHRENKCRFVNKICNILNIYKNSYIEKISTFCMLELGRPNNIYDANKIVGNIHVKYSAGGEIFISRDNIKYVLPKNILIITDDIQVISIAGIMTSKLTEVSKITNNVIIETSNFDPTTINKTSKLLSISTESSYRFTRRIDFSSSIKFIQYLCNNITDTFEGSIGNAYRLKGIKQNYTQKIYFESKKIGQYYNYNINHNEMHSKLKSLGFKLQEHYYLVPSWRQGDVIDHACLLEEYIRMVGLDSIQVHQNKKININNHNIIKDEFHDIKHRLLTRGIFEQLHWSFSSHQNNMLFSNKKSVLIKETTKENNAMRTSLVPNLIGDITKNNIHILGNISCFEIGKIFYIEEKKIHEEYHLTIIRCGLASKKSVFTTQRLYDFYDVKDDIYSVLDEMNVDIKNIYFSKNTNQYYSDKNSVSLNLNKQVIGHIGELSIQHTKLLKVKQPIFIGEIILNAIPKKNIDIKSNYKNMDCLIIKRDFAFLFCDTIKSIDIIKTIQSLNINNILSIEIFDVFTKKDFNNKKSIAFSIKIKLLHYNKFIVEKISDRVVSSIQQNLNGEIRDKI